VAQLIADAVYLFAGMPPTWHPLDPDKFNRALGFPALITGLCQSFGVPVAPSKVIRSPITRAFIEKYCTQRQAQGGDPQAPDAPPPPPQADPAGSFDTERYLRHLVRQQAANHRAHCRPMTLYISLASACRARVLLLFHALLRISLGQRSHGPEIGLRPRLQRHPLRLSASQMRPARMRRCQICSAREWSHMTGRSPRFVFFSILCSLFVIFMLCYFMRLMFGFVVLIVFCFAYTFCLDCCVSAYVVIVDNVYLKFRNRVEFHLGTSS